MAYELFFDGFEGYPSIPELLKFGYTETVVTTGTTWPNTVGRRGGNGLQFFYNSNLTRPITASTHVVVGAAIYADALPLALQLRNGTTIHAAIDITALTPMTVYAGGATIGTSTASYPYKTYMFVEIGVSVGAQGTCEVRVNGSSVGWFPLATLDTQNGATATIDNIRFDQIGYGSHIIDDFYVTYGNELVWLGDSRVDRLLLTGNTATQDWTPNTGNAWERLNAGNGYVESDVDEATSFFELADLSYNPLAIHGVKVGGLIKKSDAGYREACLLTNSDGTITETSPPLVLSTDTFGIVTTLKTDPATGLAWDLPGVQALQPGLRVKA